MFPTKRPSTLASFAYAWVGGDIHGLSALAGTLYGYLPHMDGVITAVDKKVADLVSDAGWQGPAASAFAGAWQADARGALGLGAAVEVIGDTVDSLAVRLAELENELETAADRAAASGVTVNPDGSPGASAVRASGSRLVLTQELAALQDAATSYGSLRQRILADAKQARLDAATTLENLYQQLAPGSAHPGSSAATASIADQLRAFWGVSTSFRWEVRQDATALAGEGAAAVSAWLAEGGAVAEFGNASWHTPNATDPAPAGAVGGIAGTFSAGQGGQPWYEGISEDSLASVTDAAVATGVGAAVSAGGALSFVSAPLAGATVGAKAGGVLSAGVGKAVGKVLGEDDGSEGNSAGESVGHAANRFWNPVIQ